MAPIIWIRVDADLLRGESRWLRQIPLLIRSHIFLPYIAFMLPQTITFPIFSAQSKSINPNSHLIAEPENPITASTISSTTTEVTLGGCFMDVDMDSLALFFKLKKTRFLISIVNKRRDGRS